MQPARGPRRTCRVNIDEFKRATTIPKINIGKSGLVIPNDKTYLIETRLIGLLRDFECNDLGDLYRLITVSGNQDALTKVIDQMTTNETLWFRDNNPFLTFKEHILPDIVRRWQSGEFPKIRIWSAACSTGQEPYSLSMLLHDYAKEHFLPKLINGGVEILATDLCTTAISQAKNGVYDGFSIGRGLPEAQRDTYFSPVENRWQVKDSVKSLVRFQQFNLQDNYIAHGMFDVVFLRNVLIYFDDDFKRRIIGKMAQVLRPNGKLFVGSTEIVTALAPDFTLNNEFRAMFYERK